MTPALAPPPFRDLTVGDLLTHLARALPERPALLYENGPRYTFADLERQAGAATLVTIGGFRGVDYIASLEQIGITRGGLPGSTLERLYFIPRGNEITPDGFTPYAELRVAGAGVPESVLDDRSAAVGVDDVINMPYTSGTTGFPKGVMLSSRNIVNNGEALGQKFKLRDEHVAADKTEAAGNGAVRA